MAGSAVAAVVLAACGGDDQSTTTTNSASSDLDRYCALSQDLAFAEAELTRDLVEAEASGDEAQQAFRDLIDDRRAGFEAQAAMAPEEISDEAATLLQYRLARVGLGSASLSRAAVNQAEAAEQEFRRENCEPNIEPYEARTGLTGTGGGEVPALETTAYDEAEPVVGDVVAFATPLSGYRKSGPACVEEIEKDELCAAPGKGRSGIPAIKRVVATGGDRIEIVEGRVILNGEPADEPFARPCDEPDVCTYQGAVTVPDGYVYVLGDERESSVDSRQVGPIPVQWLLGRIIQ